MTAHAFSDRKVPYRSARQIKEIVRDLIERCGMKGLLSIDIVRLIEGYLKPKLKGRLEIELYDQVEGQPPAYVSYEPLTLHVDREIWREARQGEPGARYVLAHEVGHIVMHKHDELGYQRRPAPLFATAPRRRDAER